MKRYNIKLEGSNSEDKYCAAANLCGRAITGVCEASSIELEVEAEYRHDDYSHLTDMQIHGKISMKLNGLNRVGGRRTILGSTEIA